MTTTANTTTAGARLGTLLVEHGLLTFDELQRALAEQQRSGVPLGRALVQLGLATPAAVAQALATQQGGLAKTEFGMAVGFGTSVAGADRPPPVTAARPRVELETELREAEARLAGMAEQMVAAARRIAELEVENRRLAVLVRRSA